MERPASQSDAPPDIAGTGGPVCLHVHQGVLRRRPLQRNSVQHPTAERGQIPAVRYTLQVT